MINHLVGRILYDNVYIGKQILGFYPYIVFIIIYCGSYAAMVRTFIMIYYCPLNIATLIPTH